MARNLHRLEGERREDLQHKEGHCVGQRLSGGQGMLMPRCSRSHCSAVGVGFIGPHRASLALLVALGSSDGGEGAQWLHPLPQESSQGPADHLGNRDMKRFLGRTAAGWFG